ncbi:MAG: 4Fe-4S dicluster domain-containing protein [Candidatus Hodarchaeota archaeon]
MLQINYDFRNKIIKKNITLSGCYQCSTCTGGCPVALITNGKYNPRKIIEQSILGLREKLVESDDANLWLCSTCQKCVELCPQLVELTEIFTLIKNECFEAGKAPAGFTAQADAIYKSGLAIPLQPAILKRREQLGIPEIKFAPVEEIQTLLKETGLEKLLPKGGE